MEIGSKQDFEERSKRVKVLKDLIVDAIGIHNISFISNDESYIELWGEINGLNDDALKSNREHYINLIRHRFFYL